MKDMLVHNTFAIACTKIVLTFFRHLAHPRLYLSCGHEQRLLGGRVVMYVRDGEGLMLIL